MPSWARDYLFLPLVVGLIVAAFTVGVPYLMADILELSYEISSPIPYLDDPAMKLFSISLNGRPVESIVAHRVNLFNSGDKPIKDLPVTIIFKNNSDKFNIMSINHDTNPKHEFGTISELERKNNSIRLRYSLLNKGDSDLITILASDKSDSELFAKAEGLSLVKVDNEGWFSGKNVGYYSNLFAAIAGLIAAAGSLLSSLFIKNVTNRN